jgi:hypothetical protein
VNDFSRKPQNDGCAHALAAWTVPSTPDRNEGADGAWLDTFGFAACIVASSESLAAFLQSPAFKAFSNRRARTVIQQCPMLGTNRTQPGVREADACVVKTDIQAIRHVSTQ